MSNSANEEKRARVAKFVNAFLIMKAHENGRASMYKKDGKETLFRTSNGFGPVIDANLEQGRYLDVYSNFAQIAKSLYKCVLSEDSSLLAAELMILLIRDYGFHPRVSLQKLQDELGQKIRDEDADGIERVLDNRFIRPIR